MGSWATFFSGGAAEWAALPFALSLLVLGMPHGAADGAVLWRERRGLDGRGGRLAAAYLAVDAAALAVLLVAPAATLLAFLGLTVWHFGRTAADRAGGKWLGRTLAEATLLVLLPFCFQPAATLALFDDLVALAGGDAGFPSVVVPLSAIACGVAGLWWIGSLFRSNAREGEGLERRDFARLVALVLTPALLPPLASVGVLFLCLHAGPECCALGRRLFPETRGSLARLARVHLVALPLWIPVLVAIAWLWPLAGERVPTAGPLYAAALFTLLACCTLTPAHEWLRHRLAVPARNAEPSAAEARRGPSAFRAKRPHGPRRSAAREAEREADRSAASLPPAGKLAHLSHAELS